VLYSHQLPVGADQEIDLVELSRLLWVHRYLVAAVAVICVSIAVVLALTMTPKYRAEATVTSVMREPSLGGGGGAAGAAGGLGGSIGGIASLVGLNIGSGGNAAAQDMALLKSHHLAEEFIKRYGLIPLLLPKPNQPHTMWRAVDRFKASVLKITEDKRAGTTTVSVTWTDAATAAKWTNDFIGLANELIRDRSVEETRRNIDFLNKEIARTSIVGVQSALFGLIENETKNLMIASSRAEYAFALVDPAVPPEVRSSPQRTLMVGVGAALGLFLAVSIVFIINSAQRKRRHGQAPHAAPHA
jgi:uncharacterized protein involved in exopolysaccharide biosynthesis